MVPLVPEVSLVLEVVGEVLAFPRKELRPQHQVLLAVLVRDGGEGVDVVFEADSRDLHRRPIRQVRLEEADEAVVLDFAAEMEQAVADRVDVEADFHDEFFNKFLQKVISDFNKSFHQISDLKSTNFCLFHSLNHQITKECKCN